MESDWTPANVSGLIGNPFYAININPVLATPHELLVSEEQWIAANVKQIQDLGPGGVPSEPALNPQGQLSEVTLRDRPPSSRAEKTTEFRRPE